MEVFVVDPSGNTRKEKRKAPVEAGSIEELIESCEKRHRTFARYEKAIAWYDERIENEHKVLKAQTTRLVIATDLICNDHHFWSAFSESLAFEVMTAPIYIGCNAEGIVITPAAENSASPRSWYTTVHRDHLLGLSDELCGRALPTQNITVDKRPMSHLLTDVLGVIASHPSKQVDGLILIAENGCDTLSLHMAKEFRKQGLKTFVLDASSQRLQPHKDVAHSDLIRLAQEMGGVHLAIDRYDTNDLRDTLRTASALCSGHLYGVQDFMERHQPTARVEALLAASMKAFTFAPSVHQMKPPSLG